MNGTLGHRLLAGLAISSSLLIATASADQPAAASPAADKSSTEAKPAQAGCVRSTGTRIKSKKDDCLGFSGRTYTSEDLARTGDSDVGAALRRLDPSIGGSVR